MPKKTGAIQPIDAKKNLQAIQPIHCKKKTRRQKKTGGYPAHTCLYLCQHLGTTLACILPFLCICCRNRWSRCVAKVCPLQQTCLCCQGYPAHTCQKNLVAIQPRPHKWKGYPALGRMPLSLSAPILCTCCSRDFWAFCQRFAHSSKYVSAALMFHIRASGTFIWVTGSCLPG